jgi:hypothetical protein
MPRSKPFDAIEREPTVSPYLNLHRPDDDTESAPNYYAFVRPQLEQMEANRKQQQEIQRLQRQVQRGPGTTAARRGGTALPTTGTAARFMDTAQFYSSWPR